MHGRCILSCLVSGLSYLALAGRAEAAGELANRGMSREDCRVGGDKAGVHECILH
jgi:hypothetical protein